MLDWLNCLKTFLTVVETKSFSKAANALYKSPSAISKQISTLENYLKTVLFIRSTRKLELTPAGAALYEQAGKLLLELDMLKTSLIQPNKKISGNIIVKAPIQFGENFLSSLFADFILKYPEICLTVLFSTDRLFIREDRFDLAIRSEEYPLQDKKHREFLCKKERGIFAAKKYLVKQGVPQTLEELHQHQCIVMVEQQDKFSWILKDKLIFEPNGSLVTNNPNMMKAALKAGLGLVYVSDYFLQDELASGKL